MVRKVELLVSVALLGSAATAIWLWGQLHDERTRNAELSARLNAQSNTVVTVLEPSAPSTPRATAEPAASAPNPANPALVEPLRVVQGTPDDRMAHQRRMLQQPKYREAWRAQMRLNYTLRRDNVIRLLGFTPEEADAVVEIAIERQLSWIDRASEKPMSQESTQQQQALYEQDKREDDVKLREVLGEAKLAQFQEYMESRSTRIHVDQLRPRFTGTDTLRDDQVEPLIAALHVERTRLHTEQQEFRKMSHSDDSPSVQQYSERELELLRAAHERMHVAVAPILSASQLKRFDVLQKRDLERQELEGRMQSGAADEDVANTR